MFFYRDIYRTNILTFLYYIDELVNIFLVFIKDSSTIISQILSKFVLMDFHTKILWSVRCAKKIEK